MSERMHDVVDDSEGQWTPLAPLSSLVSVGWREEEMPKKKKKRIPNKIKKVKKAKVKNRKEDDLGSQEKPETGTRLSTENVRLDCIGDFCRDFLLDSSVDGMQSIEGHARIQVMSGRAIVMGFSLAKGSEAIVNFPSWSYSVPLKSLGQCAVALRIQSMSEVDPSITPLAVAPRPLIISQSWEAACDTVLDRNESGVRLSTFASPLSTESFRVLICGAKSTGKSTFLKYLVNRHLSHQGSVIVLDCDVGQPELSPPGMLTLTHITEPLLSLPHLHTKRQHLKAHFFGHVTSRNDPTTYLELILDLLQVYKQSIEKVQANTPLVVNTDGWVKGFGFEVLSTIIERVKPTFVVQLTGTSPAKAFDLDPSLPKESTLVRAEAFESLSLIDIPAPAPRSLRLSSYFLKDSLIWDRVSFGCTGILDYDCEIANTLAAQRPYVVPFHSVRCEVPFVSSSAAVLDSLNGSIVGLCADKEDEMYASCLGLGVVRSVDRHRMLLYILSPVPLDRIRHVTVLTKGTIDLPVECIYRGIHSETLPYVACTRKIGSVGSEIMKSRQNIGRTSLNRAG